VNEQLSAIIADTLGLDADGITPALSRESEAAWDSLNHLRLITAVEGAFGVKFTMAEIQGITTAGELEQKLAAREAG
jgi:acyl carrier protein